MTFTGDLFRCREGLHGVTPGDPMDPAGTACQCGAMALIGVMAAAKGDRKIFVRYLIDTTPPDDETDEGLLIEAERAAEARISRGDFGQD